MTISAKPRQKSISGMRFRFISLSTSDIAPCPTAHPAEQAGARIKTKSNLRDYKEGLEFSGNMVVGAWRTPYREERPNRARCAELAKERSALTIVPARLEPRT